MQDKIIDALVILALMAALLFPTSDLEPEPSLLKAGQMDKGIKRATMMWIQMSAVSAKEWK
jgi:hypothetical protein